MRTQFRLSDLIPADLYVEAVHQRTDSIVIAAYGQTEIAGVLNAVQPPIKFIVAILG